MIAQDDDRPIPEPCALESLVVLPDGGHAIRDLGQVGGRIAAPPRPPEPGGGHEELNRLATASRQAHRSTFASLN